MRLTWFELAALCISVLLILSACSTSPVYRPEVDEFKKAVAEVNAYVKAKQSAVRNVRENLRRDVLSSERPMIRVSENCRRSISNMRDSSSSGGDAEGCRLKLPGDSENAVLGRIFNPEGQFADSAAFAAAVMEYAVALDKVAKSSDKRTFLEAANGLVDVVISLASSAAIVAGAEKPNSEAFKPVAKLVNFGAFYYLEGKRAKALKVGAKSAHPWIEKGSAAVVDILYSAQVEIANKTLEGLRAQVDKVNEAGPDSYSGEADKAIIQAVELRSQVGSDPSAPFKKLPEAHKKLVEAFKDGNRNIALAIAAAKDLFNAARDAQAALERE